MEDINKFLERISLLPLPNQSLMLNEKIKYQVSQLQNYYEELYNQNELGEKVKKFMGDLQKRFVEGQFQSIEEIQVFKQNLNSNIEKLTLEIDRFQFYFQQLKETTLNAEKSQIFQGKI